MMIAGSVESYVKNLFGQKEAMKKVSALSAKTNMAGIVKKKQEQLYGAGAAAMFEKSDEPKTQADMIREQLEAMRPDETAIRMQNLDNKMKSGKKLSPDDLAFLKDHNPDMYDKAVRIEEERKEYKEALKRCRTKEDVMRVKAMALNKVMVDKSMTPEEKVCHVAAIHDEHKDFTKTERFKKMPINERDAEKKRGRVKKLDEVEDVEFVENAVEPVGIESGKLSAAGAAGAGGAGGAAGAAGESFAEVGAGAGVKKAG